MFVALTDECSHFRLQVAGDPCAVGVCGNKGRSLSSLEPLLIRGHTPHRFAGNISRSRLHTCISKPFLRTPDARVSSPFVLCLYPDPARSFSLRICHRSPPPLDRPRRSPKASGLLTAGQNPISVSIWLCSGAMFLLLLMI